MNRGALFKNFYKKTVKQPNYLGEAEIDGVKYEIAGWLLRKPRSKNGATYISIKFTKRQPGEQNTTDQYQAIKEQLKDKMGWTQ